ncbi:MAG: RNA 2'-phosphotransferase [Thermodesulfobacteriota bacterium]
MSGGQRLKQQRESLARFLLYVLGHRPDEFGLVADEEGFVPLKELLQALGEEEGWRYVREGHLLDLLREPDRSRLEVREKLIRAAPGAGKLERGPFRPAVPPKVLYHAARRKAYPAILERGLVPAGERPFVPLFVDREMALRVGRRRDPEPVLLTVLAARASERGIVFHRPLELIYLVGSLTPDLFTGPPLPPERVAVDKKKEAPPLPPTPGSFFLDPDRIRDPGTMPFRGKKKRGDLPDWKRAARRDRRRGGRDR